MKTSGLPTAAQTQLLSFIPSYGLVTAEQLMYLAGFATIRYAQDRLKTLADLGFLDRPQRIGLAVGGSEPLVYWLSRRGRDFLRSQEIDPGILIRDPAPITRRHTLRVNDVLIAAQVFCRRDDRFSLSDSRSDATLRRQIKGPAVPDGWLDFRIKLTDGLYQVPLLLEVDRGTMARQRFQAKVTALEAWIAGGGYQQTFGTDALEAIAVVGEHARLADWIRASAREPALFRVTTAEPLPDAGAFFLDRIWRIPGQPDPVALIEL